MSTEWLQGKRTDAAFLRSAEIAHDRLDQRRRQRGAEPAHHRTVALLVLLQPVDPNHDAVALAVIVYRVIQHVELSDDFAIDARAWPPLIRRPTPSARAAFAS